MNSDCRFDHEALSEQLQSDPRNEFDAAEYLARLLPHLHSFGITRVGDITGLDRLGIPVAQACRPAARSNAVTQGKGRRLAEAAVSAVLESIEMAAGEDTRALAAWTGKVDDVDIARWAPLANGAEWPTRADSWLAGLDLASGAPAPVPAALADTDFTRTSRGQSAPILRSSIGLGAGQSPAGAAWHAMLECLENDARIHFLSASPRQVEARRLDLASIAAPTVADLVRRLHDMKLRVGAWEMTRRRGPRAVMVRLMESPASRPALPLPAEGFACRPALSQAVESALVEAAQARLALISGAREDMTQALYRHRAPEADLWAEWEYLAPGQGCPANPDGTCPERVPDLARSLSDQVAGPIVMLPLLSRPDLPLWAVRLCSPGLLADPLRLRLAVT